MGGVQRREPDKKECLDFIVSVNADFEGAKVFDYILTGEQDYYYQDTDLKVWTLTVYFQ